MEADGSVELEEALELVLRSSAAGSTLPTCQRDIPIRPACSLFKAPNASSLSSSFIPVIGSSCVESFQLQRKVDHVTPLPSVSSLAAQPLASSQLETDMHRIGWANGSFL